MGMQPHRMELPGLSMPTPIMQGLNDGSWLDEAIETLRVYKLDNTYYGFYHAADYWGTSRWIND